MKTTLIILFIILFSCKEQKKKVIPSNFEIGEVINFENDTSDKIYDEKQIFKNTIHISAEINEVVFNEKQFILKKDIEFENFIKANALNLGKKKVYITYFEGIEIKEINKVIEILRKQNIENYKVIKLGDFKLNVPAE